MSGNATDSTKTERNRTERDRLTAHSGRAALRAALDCFWYLPLYGAIETRVSAFVHLAHAARADLRGHFVDAETGTGSEGQTRVVDYTGGSAGRAG
jgi:hypothetical protein